jgi:hypothetical protein
VSDEHPPEILSYAPARERNPAFIRVAWLVAAGYCLIVMPLLIVMSRNFGVGNTSPLFAFSGPVLALGVLGWHFLKYGWHKLILTATPAGLICLAWSIVTPAFSPVHSSGPCKPHPATAIAPASQSS